MAIYFLPLMNRWLPAFCLLLALGLAPASFAQDATDVYVASIVPDDHGVALTDVRNLTNRNAYDNQPSFSKDGSILYYTCQQESGDGAQTDIWQIALAGAHKEGGGPEALTQTPESEYSPTPIPGQDALSVIRVEGDGSQKLWRIPLDGSEPSRILDRVAPVGYHAWAEDELVLFVLGEPHELQRLRGDKASNLGRIVAKDVGRALQKIPGQAAFSFVHKASSGETNGDGKPDERQNWWIKSIELRTDEIRPLVRTFSGREDFTWSPGGKLWMADGSRIYRWCPTCGGDWQLVSDLAAQSIVTVTRVAISPNGRTLAFVAEHKPAPAAQTTADEH